MKKSHFNCTHNVVQFFVSTAQFPNFLPQKSRRTAYGNTPVTVSTDPYTRSESIVLSLPPDCMTKTSVTDDPYINVNNMETWLKLY